MINDHLTPRYSQAAWPSPTEGPAVHWLVHAAQPGHGGGHPQYCQQCGLEVGRLLHHLGVGQSGRCHGTASNTDSTGHYFYCCYCDYHYYFFYYRYCGSSCSRGSSSSSSVSVSRSSSVSVSRSSSVSVSRSSSGSVSRRSSVSVSRSSSGSVSRRISVSRRSSVSRNSSVSRSSSVSVSRSSSVSVSRSSSVSVSRSSSVSVSRSSSVSVSRSSSVVQSGDADDVSGADLQWRDVVLLCLFPSRAARLFQGLTQAHIPVAVVDHSTATPGEIEDLAAALTDQVTITDSGCVRGLERRVVVGVRGSGVDRMECMSRCTGLLVWIGTPDDF